MGQQLDSRTKINIVDIKQGFMQCQEEIGSRELDMNYTLDRLKEQYESLEISMANYFNNSGKIMGNSIDNQDYISKLNSDFELNITKEFNLFTLDVLETQAAYAVLKEIMENPGLLDKPERQRRFLQELYSGNNDYDFFKQRQETITAFSNIGLINKEDYTIN